MQTTAQATTRSQDRPLVPTVLLPEMCLCASDLLEAFDSMLTNAAWIAIEATGQDIDRALLLTPEEWLAARDLYAPEVPFSAQDLCATSGGCWSDTLWLGFTHHAIRTLVLASRVLKLAPVLLEDHWHLECLLNSSERAEGDTGLAACNSEEMLLPHSSNLQGA